MFLISPQKLMNVEAKLSRDILKHLKTIFLNFLLFHYLPAPLLTTQEYRNRIRTCRAPALFSLKEKGAFRLVFFKWNTHQKLDLKQNKLQPDTQFIWSGFKLGFNPGLSLNPELSLVTVIKPIVNWRNRRFPTLSWNPNSSGFVWNQSK